MSWNLLPLAKKVGEVGEDEDKFLSWSGSHGYYSRPQTVSNPFKTDTMLNSSFDLKEMVHNQTVCTLQRELNKSQVEFKPKTGNDAKMLGVTSSMSSFVDQRSMSQLVKERCTEDNFRQSFIKVLQSAQAKDIDNVSLLLKNVPAVVVDCLGVNPAPEFVVDKFTELANRNSVGGT
jgi:hypothetical protein